MDLISVLIYIIIIGVICAVAFWGVNAIGLPAPFAMIARAIIVVIVLIALLSLLGHGRLSL